MKTHPSPLTHSHVIFSEYIYLDILFQDFIQTFYFPACAEQQIHRGQEPHTHYTITMPNTHKHTHTQHNNSLSMTLSLSLTDTHTHTHTHTHTDTHTHTHTTHNYPWHTWQWVCTWGLKVMKGYQCIHNMISTPFDIFCLALW